MSDVLSTITVEIENLCKVLKLYLWPNFVNLKLSERYRQKIWQIEHYFNFHFTKKCDSVFNTGTFYCPNLCLFLGNCWQMEFVCLSPGIFLYRGPFIFYEGGVAIGIRESSFKNCMTSLSLPIFFPCPPLPLINNFFG